MSVLRFLFDLCCNFLNWLFLGSETDYFDLPTYGYQRLLEKRRFRRRQLSDYLSTMIRSCSKMEGGIESSCNKAVQGAILFHRKSKDQNGGICLMGKYHNVLYVAARLAVTFNLQNTMTVHHLLTDMFDCEGTFERIISGAIFGPYISGALSGWKSEFDSRDECVDALKYFLHHATLAKASFVRDGLTLRMADVPLLICMNASPVTVALQVPRPEVFSLLVEYGAKIHNVPFDLLSPMKVLSDMKKEYKENQSLPSMQCLSLAWKIYPPAKGWPLPTLKHLARNAVREALNDEYKLPLGVENLPLPKTLIKYIILEGE